MLDFTLSTEEIAGMQKEVDASRQLATPTPEQNPTFKQGKSEGLGRWSEVVTIREATAGPPKDRPESTTELVFKLKLEVRGADAGGFDAPNKGRVHTYTVYVDKSKMGHPTEGSFIRRNLAVLNSLLFALGHPQDQTIKFGDYFGDDTPLLGQTAEAVFNKYEYVNKKKGGQVEQSFEVASFNPFAGA